MHSVRTDMGALHSLTTSDEFQRMAVADILYNHLHTAHNCETLPPSEIKQTGSVILQVKIIIMSNELPVLRVVSSLFFSE